MSVADNGTSADDAAKLELLALLSEEAPLEIDATDNPFGRSLVRLHAGGSKRPFYCVHPGSGAAGCFSEVAPLVDPDRPFYALQAPGIDGEREPFEDFHALAKGYVAEVRRAQPTGPYLIGGWSLGGMVAFEMARELRRQGEQVAFLGVFDSLRTDALHGVSREAATEMLWRHNGLATEHLARQRGVKLDRAIAYEKFKQAQPRSTLSRLNLMLELLVQHGVFHDGTAPMFRVFRSNMLALSDYGLPADPYDGPFTLFRCHNDELGDEIAKLDQSYNWSRSTTRPVEVIPMPSHHFALFHGEVLPVTVKHLREALDRADPR